MLAMFEATNGHNWRNKALWKTDTNIRHWYGVYVNAEGRVNRLELRTNNLTGGFMLDRWCVLQNLSWHLLGPKFPNWYGES